MGFEFMPFKETSTVGAQVFRWYVFGASAYKYIFAECKDICSCMCVLKNSGFYRMYSSINYAQFSTQPATVRLKRDLIWTVAVAISLLCI